MKKVCLFLSLLLLVSATPVFAQNTDQLNASDVAQSSTETRRSTIQEQRQQRLEAIQQQAREKRSAIADKFAERLRKRFANYYNRLTNLANKIQAKIDLMEEEGKPVTEAQSHLNQALRYLESAKNLGDQSVDGFAGISEEEYETNRDLALNARDQAKTARETFKLALESMKSAVAALREANQ